MATLISRYTPEIALLNWKLPVNCAGRLKRHVYSRMYLEGAFSRVIAKWISL